MQILHGYPQTALAHACGLCFKAGIPNETVVDTGFAVDDNTPNGDVFFCVECAGELAGLLGWISPTVADALQLEVREALDAAEAARARELAMTAAYNSLIDALVTNPELANDIAMQMRGKLPGRKPAPVPPPDATFVNPGAAAAGVVVPKSR